MAYSLTGEFIESCDCTVICPCWVDDDPVGGHCTGFILWDIDDGYITDCGSSGCAEKHSVSGCKVVSVSTHSGKRRNGRTTTTSVLYVDVGSREDEEADKVGEGLGKAFAGQSEGILGELANVTGIVAGTHRATISLLDHPDAGQAVGRVKGKAIGRQPWRIRVEEHRADKDDPVLRIEATGSPKIFDEKKQQAVADGRPAEPMSLEHTALSYELQAQGTVIAQQGDQLTVRVGALPGGNLEVWGRSGMSGQFCYECVNQNEAEPTVAAG